jgi:uncharacterized membrane protein YoaK (UPF0700 family)
MRRRQWLLVLLAVNSGAIDAVGYTMLGGSFTSVMTGNMILLGAIAATLLARHAPVWIPALELIPVGCAVCSPVSRVSCR